MTIQQLQQHPLGDGGIKIIDKENFRVYSVYAIYGNGGFLLNKKNIPNSIVSPINTLYAPVLYPISCLTREIEVYGERFVPAIEIAKRVDNGHNSLSIVKQYTGMIVVKTDKVDDVENVSIRYANGEIISICRSEAPVLLSTCNTIIQLLQSWFINYQSIEAVNPFDLKENPYK